MGLYMNPEVPYRIQTPIVKEKIKTAKWTCDQKQSDADRQTPLGYNNIPRVTGTIVEPYLAFWWDPRHNESVTHQGDQEDLMATR